MSDRRRWPWIALGLLLTGCTVYALGRWHGYDSGHAAGADAATLAADQAAAAADALAGSLAATRRDLDLSRDEIKRLRPALAAATGKASSSEREVRRLVSVLAEWQAQGPAGPAVEVVAAGPGAPTGLTLPTASPAGSGCVQGLTVAPGCRGRLYLAAGRVVGALQGRADVGAVVDGQARSWAYPGPGEYVDLPGAVVAVDPSLAEALAPRPVVWPRLEARAGVISGGYVAGATVYPFRGRLLRRVGAWAEVALVNGHGYASADVDAAVGVAVRF